MVVGKGERLLYLDGWRGLAITLVLVAHFGPKMRPDLGRFGVDLFFVLSGLLMSRILFEQRMPIGKFYRRRIARILPVFLLFVTVCWIGWSRNGASWLEIVTTLSFTRAYYTHPDIWHSVLPAGNLWSLNVEEQCYVILATIAAFPILRARAAWILFALAALTLPVLELDIHLHVQYPYSLTIEGASAGLLLSAAYRRASNWTPPVWAPATAMLGAFCCYLGVGPWYLPITAAPLLLTFSVGHIQQSWRWVVHVLEWRPLGLLGVLSYSIYLWQQIFYVYQAHFPYHTAIIAALFSGVASYYLFERPARRWLNVHWGAKSLQYSRLPETIS